MDCVEDARRAEMCHIREESGRELVLFFLLGGRGLSRVARQRVLDCRMARGNVQARGTTPEE